MATLQAFRDGLLDSSSLRYEIEARIFALQTAQTAALQPNIAEVRQPPELDLDAEVKDADADLLANYRAWYFNGADTDLMRAYKANQLAVYYEMGLHGKKTDITQALKWYRKAAELGNEASMARLAALMKESSPDEACSWAKKIRDQRSAPSC